MENKKIHRRDFLQYSVSALLALNFGCSVRDLLREEDEVAILYGTKYGSTRDTAAWISQGMDNNAALIDIEGMDYENTLSRYDYFIVGSGVWIDGVHKRLKEFLSANTGHLQNKVIASFVVCGTQDNTEGGKKRIRKYLNQFSNSLGYEPKLQKSFGGRLIVEQLTEEDRAALEKFYRKYLKQELQSWDRTDRQKAADFGSKLESEISKMSLDRV